MSLDIEFEAEFECNFDINELAEKVVNACLDYETCPYEAYVMITFTDNEGIRQINREHRDIDRATDVLSFPMVDYDKPGDFSILESEAAYEYFDPDTGELILGDIVISHEKAREQAVEYGHSFKREIGFLIAHSMFHLMGYDHMDEVERADMERRQREVLEKIGITREEA